MHVVRDFPLSRRFRAFDLAVSAAGYNSFHELLRFGIPTLFIPNQDTALDDQQGRAQFAADRGLAHMLGRCQCLPTPLCSWVICWNRGQAHGGKRCLGRSRQWSRGCCRCICATLAEVEAARA